MLRVPACARIFEFPNGTVMAMNTCMFTVFRLTFGRARKFQEHGERSFGAFGGSSCTAALAGWGGVGQEADADTTKGFVLCVVFRPFFEGSGLKH